MMKLNVGNEAGSCKKTVQSARNSDNLRNDTICHRCGKPMKLVWRTNDTGTKQGWVCRECFRFGIVRLADYTVSPR